MSAPAVARAPDRAEIDAALAARLIAGQFPQWADLPVRPVAQAGWDNRTFHLGETMSVRLPSAAGYAPQIEKEHAWLPRLAPLLPLPVPAPLAIGEPSDGYPWRWSVYAWLDGETAAEGAVADMTGFAAALAGFLVALQGVDPSDGPAAGPHSFWRGGPLSTYDAETRNAIAALDGQIDAAAATQAWNAALDATWRGPPVWVHGDVAVGNLLLRDGRLGAVIDFGCCAVGDPACDLVIAWTLFDGESREAFRAALALDEATWARGGGWALWKALITLANPRIGQSRRQESRRVIEQVIGDHQTRKPLRLIEAADAHFAWMLGEANAPGELSLPPGGVDKAPVVRWLRGNLAALDGRGSWLMVDGGEVVGLCSYKRPPDADGSVEIGYGVAPRRRRQGHATRAVAALLAEAAADPRVRRLTAETAIGNVASQRVVGANGFVRAGSAYDADEGEMIV